MPKILPSLIVFQLLALGLFAQPYAIGSRTYNLQDASRGNRSVPTEVFYPANTAGSGVPVATGNFPVIIFAHGFTMDYDAYENFWQELVPQGYIMAFPRTETSAIPFPDHGALAQDLVFLRQQFQDWGQNSATLFYRKLNDRYAYSGHSMGGGCSFIATSLDTGVTALVNFAAAETNPSAIQEAGQISNVPALIFAGERDCVTPTASNQTPMYDSLKSACKFYVEIIDGMHCRFADANFLCDAGEITCQPISSISRSDQHSRTFAVLNPWLEFMLQRNCDSWDEFNQALAGNSNITYRALCSYSPFEPEIFNLTDTIFCEGDSVQFFIETRADSFIWSNGIANQDTIWVGTPDIYSASTVDEFGCTEKSKAIIAIQKTKPVAKLSASDTFLCPEEEAILRADSSYASYLWSNGSTDSLLSVSDSGIFSVRIEGSNGCFGRSDSVSITKAQEYPRPLITKNGDTLSVRSGNAVQWFFNGDSIPGATSGVYLVDTFGNFHAVVLEESGCFSKSDTVSFIFDFIDPAGQIIESIYPNPFKDRLAISLVKDAQIMIHDLMGKLIWLGSSHAGLFELKTSDWESGAYILTVQQSNDGERFSWPLIKE